MLPSSTVENYLKAIYVGETHLVGGQKLVPMGQLAAALGIAPGTATTMVKALAESGLVSYEPYNGVRLTSAGEKPAERAPRPSSPIKPVVVQISCMAADAAQGGAAQRERSVAERVS